MRANAGEGPRDPWLLTHFRGFKGADILAGVYTYILFDTSPLDDMEAIKRVTDGLDMDLPVALDIESLNGVVPSKAREWLAKIVEDCRAYFGHKPLPYFGPDFWENKLQATSMSLFADFVPWISHYGAARPKVPKPFTTWGFWQYAANTIWVLPDGSQAWGPKKPHPLARVIARPGLVDGVDGEVDCDAFNGTMEDLRGLLVKSAA